MARGQLERLKLTWSGVLPSSLQTQPKTSLWPSHALDDLVGEWPGPAPFLQRGTWRQRQTGSCANAGPRWATVQSAASLNAPPQSRGRARPSTAMALAPVLLGQYERQ
eukprot:scaffold966_cov415-Prasinococcus_capsulatus_cf.AAC.25